MKLAVFIAIGLAGAASGQAPATAVNHPTNPKVRHIIGLENVKGNASGVLSVRDGMLHFQTGKASSDVAVSSIDDVFIGAETTQAGGKTGRVVKTAAIAAPFESGKALTILMRTKVDILTVAFHDPAGAVRGAIFALPKGQAQPMRDQLIQAGARTGPVAEVER